MTVTRDVILDLLPLYFAGHISTDTKALVDEFLKNDPDFARMSQRFDALLKDHAAPADSDAMECRAFERTRRLLRFRNQTVGMAIAYSLLPFSFLFKDGRTYWLLRSKPSIAFAFGCTALACWVAAYIINRRARLG